MLRQSATEGLPPRTPLHPSSALEPCCSFPHFHAQTRCQRVETHQAGFQFTLIDEVLASKANGTDILGRPTGNSDHFLDWQVGLKSKQPTGLLGRKITKVCPQGGAVG